MTTAFVLHKEPCKATKSSTTMGLSERCLGPENRVQASSLLRHYNAGTQSSSPLSSNM